MGTKEGNAGTSMFGLSLYDEHLIYTKITTIPCKICSTTIAMTDFEFWRAFCQAKHVHSPISSNMLILCMAIDTCLKEG